MRLGYFLILALLCFWLPRPLCAQTEMFPVNEQTLVREEPAERLEQRLGLATHLNGAGGVLYESSLSETRHIWTEVSYRDAANTRDFLDNPTREVAAVRYEEKDQIRALVGIDQLLMINKRRTWALLAGVALGVNRSEFYTQFYRLKCQRYCVFDSNPYADDTTVDMSLIGVLRLGVRVRDIRVMGEKSDLSVVASSTRLRLPTRVAVTAPNGREFVPRDHLNDNTVALEATLGF